MSKVVSLFSHNLMLWLDTFAFCIFYRLPQNIWIWCFLVFFSFIAEEKNPENQHTKLTSARSIQWVRNMFVATGHPVAFTCLSSCVHTICSIKQQEQPIWINLGCLKDMSACALLEYNLKQLIFFSPFFFLFNESIFYYLPSQKGNICFFILYMMLVQ